MFTNLGFRAWHIRCEGVEKHFLSGGVFCRQCQAFSLHAVPPAPEAEVTVAEYQRQVRKLGFHLMRSSPMVPLGINCAAPETTLLSDYRQQLARIHSDIVLVHGKTTLSIQPAKAK